MDYYCFSKNRNIVPIKIFTYYDHDIVNFAKKQNNFEDELEIEDLYDFFIKELANIYSRYTSFNEKAKNDIQRLAEKYSRNYNLDIDVSGIKSEDSLFKTVSGEKPIRFKKKPESSVEKVKESSKSTEKKSSSESSSKLKIGLDTSSEEALKRSIAELYEKFGDTKQYYDIVGKALDKLYSEGASKYRTQIGILEKELENDPFVPAIQSKSTNRGKSKTKKESTVEEKIPPKEEIILDKGETLPVDGDVVKPETIKTKEEPISKEEEFILDKGKVVPLTDELKQRFIDFLREKTNNNYIFTKKSIASIIKEFNNQYNTNIDVNSIKSATALRKVINNKDPNFSVPQSNPSAKKSIEDFNDEPVIESSTELITEPVTASKELITEPSDKASGEININPNDYNSVLNYMRSLSIDDFYENSRSRTNLGNIVTQAIQSLLKQYKNYEDNYPVYYDAIEKLKDEYYRLTGNYYKMPTGDKTTEDGKRDYELRKNYNSLYTRIKTDNLIQNDIIPRVQEFLENGEYQKARNYLNFAISSQGGYEYAGDSVLADRLNDLIEKVNTNLPKNQKISNVSYTQRSINTLNKLESKYSEEKQNLDTALKKGEIGQEEYDQRLGAIKESYLGRIRKINSRYESLPEEFKPFTPIIEARTSSPLSLDSGDQKLRTAIAKANSIEELGAITNSLNYYATVYNMANSTVDAIKQEIYDRFEKIQLEQQPAPNEDEIILEKPIKEELPNEDEIILEKPIEEKVTAKEYRPSNKSTEEDAIIYKIEPINNMLTPSDSNRTPIRTPIEDGNRRSIRIPIEDGNRRSIRIPIEDGNRRSIRIPIEDGNRRSIRIPIEDGNRRSIRIPIEDGNRIPKPTPPSTKPVSTNKPSPIQQLLSGLQGLFTRPKQKPEINLLRNRTNKPVITTNRGTSPSSESASIAKYDINPNNPQYKQYVYDIKNKDDLVPIEVPKGLEKNEAVYRKALEPKRSRIVLPSWAKDIPNYFDDPNLNRGGYFSKKKHNIIKL